MLLPPFDFFYLFLLPVFLLLIARFLNLKGLYPINFKNALP